MDVHKNARRTYVRRLEMVREITGQSMSIAQAARRAGMTAATARKWLGRYLACGEAGLVDASSRPIRSPRTIAPATGLRLHLPALHPTHRSPRGLDESVQLHRPHQGIGGLAPVSRLSSKTHNLLVLHA